ncbi:CubicO group peptidase (beta-lactamase class C family) [Chitinophaga dinghuensis]|uniref:CubicO group peptidase (Beta-lactamase class C family) n=1 Tax=Chitinophaga dinghuensis TaxID=1539050 RepID=A0A327VY33_9BACT|nr:serine hydrolase [Chitinophaga dinghuensis]RAJ81951.1 CubicO group peptidase (beta-lactamase class C family) [Chitinophaga dinghuensis]
MKQILIAALLLATGATQAQQTSSKTYFPPRDNWEHRTPAALGLRSDKLDAAIQFAIKNESRQSRNMDSAQWQSFGKEPYSEPVGALIDRADPSGIIIYKGYIIAEWGQPSRVDITNSVTKSFLSAVVGVAVDKGLIRSVYDTVAQYMPPVEVYHPGQPTEIITPFASAHNRQLTWDVMLRQTSDWEGTLWGKPDWADRPDSNFNAWKTRPRHAPGAVWKYNDTRVNALALAATNVWRKPLPQVLQQYIMEPIGASSTWRWMGYHNAWIVLDGQPVQSVSGGGHYGGGMYINTYDMGRFGLLTLNRGVWNGSRLLSEQWVKQSLTPTAANNGYGYMNWFLNTDHKLAAKAPVSSYIHIGNGANIIYVDPEHNLVAVVRWIESKAIGEMIGKLLEAIPEK